MTTLSETLARTRLPQCQVRELQWIEVTGANGLPVPLRGFIETRVTIGEEQVEAVILVTQDHPRAPNCLLGMNVLGRLPSWRRRLHLPDSAGLTQTVRTASAAVIPANTIHHVKVAVKNNAWCGDVLMDQLKHTAQRDIFLIPTVVRVEKGIAEVPVVNPTDEDIVVPARTRLGLVSSDFTENPAICMQTTSRGSSSQAGDECRGGQGYPEAAVDLSTIKFGPGLGSDERAALEKVIQENADVFAWNDDQLGFTHVVRHAIPLTDETPIAQRYRRLPPHCLKEVEAHIDDLLAKGIITPSASPYAAPIVIVRKKDGSIRLCCDYRAINARTRKDSFPLPRIEETLDAVGGATLFSSLDFASGYHQIGMEPEDQHKTAFITPFGLYEYTRMPFGLCNAPATFQRMINATMSPYIFRILICYLDDLLIYSKDLAGHVKALGTVFQRLREINVRLKPSKCEFAMAQVTFLGHQLSAEGIGTDDSKIEAIRDWKTPQTLHEVRSFLGLAGYYRRYVKGFSTIARPLHSLAKQTHDRHPKDRDKGEKRPLGTLWTESCENAFQILKTRLITAPVLGYPDYRLPFELETDASHEGLGAILSQKQADGVRVIAYASRTLRGPERNPRNYSTMKLEFLALKWAVCDKFRGYLMGHRFTAVTDNNPLSHLQKARLGALEQRWAADLAIFDFDIVYRSGRQNQAADALSRQPLPTTLGPQEEDDIVAMNSTTCAMTCQDTCLTLGRPSEIPLCITESMHLEVSPQPAPDPDRLSPADIKAAQHLDPTLQKLIKAVATGKLPAKEQRAEWPDDTRPFINRFHRFCLVDGALHRTVNNPELGTRSVIVVPASLRTKVLQLAHDSCGHQGSERVYNLLSRRCFWPKMNDDIIQHCQSCRRCQEAKRNARPVQKVPHHITARLPFEIVALDFTKVEQDRYGRENILVITDVFSKWTKAVPTPDQTAETVAKVLIKEWITHYGPPLRIHSDRGRSFENHLIYRLCEHYAIKKSRTTAHYPQGNGQTERFNKTLIGLLASLTPEQKRRWPELLPELVFFYNSTPHTTTGLSPYSILFGREATLPVDLFLGTSQPSTAPDSVFRHIQKLEEVREIARRQAAHYREAVDRRMQDAGRHPAAVEISIGDQVLRRVFPLGRVKIADKFGEETWTVVNTPGPNNGSFVVRNAQGQEETVNGVNLRKLVPATRPELQQTTEQEEDAETEPQLGRGKRHRKQTIIYNALIHACRRKDAMTNTYKAVVGIFCLLACYWLY